MFGGKWQMLTSMDQTPWYRRFFCRARTLDLRATRDRANQGDAAAQFNLGMRCHRAGVWGLQQDASESKIEAYKWLQLAAAQGYKGSTEACDRVTLGMTREEVTEGDQGASAFIATKPTNPEVQ